jgi:predicted transcriptional regulator
MDNKEHNDNILNWKELGFFSADEYLLYVFKKVEKITSALYLVSGLLKDEEPIKWELRDKGMELLDSSFTASCALPGDKNSFIQNIFTSSLETISLLNVAKISNLISDMNHKILVSEIDGILQTLRRQLLANAESAGYVLSEAFFKTPSLYSGEFKGVAVKDNVNTGMGVSGKSNNASNIDTKGHSGILTSKGQGNRTSRQELIINTLKGQNNLTIKDFTKVIKDCSEKTIQRELLDLVEKGLIKKEGERRWSRYSIK